MRMSREMARAVGEGASRLLIAILVVGVTAAAGPATAATGGPDAYGYTWVDSDEPGGPIYDAAFQPPAGGLGLCEQEWYTVNLGFTFPFYGSDYTRVAISANGVLYPTNASLDTMNGGDNLNACPIAAGLHPRIAVLWDNYYANNNYLICGGGAFFITSVFGYTTLGASPDRVFVVSWVENRRMSCGNGGATFTARLYEADGAIEFHYQDVTFGDAACDGGASATVGLADASALTGSELEVDCDLGGLVSAGYALRFEAPSICPDADGDGYEDEACGGEDCDDGNGFIHPMGNETAYDGVDQDCDGQDWTDVDGDGFDWDGVVGGDDCDDHDAAVFPGAVETCNGIDDDCDGSVDDGFDGDGDGYSVCAAPLDCWDGDPATHPGAAELADGVDNDCDGTVDEGTDGYDDDGDGATEDGGDCDDADPGVHPAAPELADGVDNDCDGTTDEGTDVFDDDGDGYAEVDGDCHDGDAAIHPGAGDPMDGIDNDCDGETDGYGADSEDDDGDGFAESGGDCDDADAAIHPGATELENGLDDDCDGAVDDGTAVVDDDGDGYAEIAGDCDDADPGIHPDADELGNGLDDDCDGTVDEGTGYVDDDGDGFTDDGGDCDDGDPAVFPGAGESANGVDDDCDGLVDEGSEAHDDDGDGLSEDEGDCDDGDPWVSPSTDEMCDGLDNDCDGDVDEGCGGGDDEPDGDGDTCAIAPDGSPPGVRGALALVTFLALLGLSRRARRAGWPAALLVIALLAPGCGSDVSISQGVRDLSVTPSLLDMGAVAVGGAVEEGLLLNNVGQAAVTIASLSIQDDDHGAFELLGEVSTTVERGSSVEVTIRYAPVTEDLHQASLAIVSDAGEVTQLDVPLRGQGAEPVLQVYPGVLDLGVLGPGVFASTSLTLAAEGLVPVTVDDLVLEGEGLSIVLPASAGELPFLVPAGADVQVQVEFDPPDAEPYEGSIRVLTDDPDDPQVTVPVLANVCQGSAAATHDADGDGFSTCGGDCDDGDPAVHPAATEHLDGVDNDCDGTIDDGTVAYDDDGDGYSEQEGDCDDTAADSYPGATELLDGRDNDCDGEVDDGTEGLDDDGDGFAESGGDCDDGDPSLNPAAEELEDGLDNDCDGVADEGTGAFDDDGDGVSENGGDCHDGDPDVGPGAPEIANGIDDDCDSLVDEGTDWYDDDGDGFTEAGGDCDDGDIGVSPADAEIPGNGIDDDCDGVAE